MNTRKSSNSTPTMPNLADYSKTRESVVAYCYDFAYYLRNIGETPDPIVLKYATTPEALQYFGKSMVKDLVKDIPGVTLKSVGIAYDSTNVRQSGIMDERLNVFLTNLDGLLSAEGKKVVDSAVADILNGAKRKSFPSVNTYRNALNQILDRNVPESNAGMEAGAKFERVR